jgi:hypothetical protein
MAMKANQCNKKMELEKPEPHVITDPDFIALMEYMQNTKFNPGWPCALLNKPVFTQGHSALVLLRTSKSRSTPLVPRTRDHHSTLSLRCTCNSTFQIYTWLFLCTPSLSPSRVGQNCM